MRSNELCQLLQSYLVPANNIYWRHQLECYTLDEDKDNLSLLKKHFLEFTINLNSLKELYFATEKLCAEKPKMYDFINDLFNKHFKLLKSYRDYIIPSVQDNIVSGKTK